MSKNTTIFMIRHAEKPADAADSDAELPVDTVPAVPVGAPLDLVGSTGAPATPLGAPPEVLGAAADQEKKVINPDLAPEGHARAAAYTVYLPGVVMAATEGSLDYVFASADSNASYRPRLTVQPLSQLLFKADPQTPFPAECVDDMANLLKDPRYRGSNIMVCWHHGQILNLAKALGAHLKSLPPESCWPSEPWPADVFGWLLQLTFDGNGNLVPEQTRCINQRLMYDDCAKEPPLGVWNWGSL